MKLVVSLLFLFWSVLALHADFASETLAQINLERQKVGLGPLASDPALMSIAQEWADKLAGQKYLQHRSLGGLKEYLQKYSWHGMNENLHCSTTPLTPAFVVQCWMNSPVHHENLMRPKINMGGIGIREGADGLTYVVFNGAF
jgi:uncharacterized protein YkwD